MRPDEYARCDGLSLADLVCRGEVSPRELARAAEAAIDQVEVLLSIPSNISVVALRHDPFWDPLRNHPRFQALLAKYE